MTSIDFIFTPAQPFVKATVTFTATATPLGATAPITYAWGFGDGITTTVTTASVRHVYTTDGSKTVQLTAYNPCTPAGVQAQHTVVVEEYRVFLPLVVRH